MADPYPYKRYGMIDTPTALGGGVAFRPSASPGSMQGVPTQAAMDYLQFLELQRKKREEEAIQQGLIANPELGNISMSGTGYPRDPAPDDPISLLHESADTGKVDHMLSAALRNLGETIMPSAQAAEAKPDQLTYDNWLAERNAAEIAHADRMPDGAGMDHWPQPPTYSSRHGLTDQGVRGLLDDAAKSGRSIARADDPEGAAQAVDDFSSYPEVPTRSFGQGLSDALFTPSEPTQIGGSGPFQNYAETMIAQEADRAATQEARQDLTGEVVAPIDEVLLPDVNLEREILDQKKLNIAEQIKDETGAVDVTGQEVSQLADASEEADDGDAASLTALANDTAWSPRETFPRNVAQKRERYLKALNDIFMKAMILNVVAGITGTESNAEFFVKMALAKMDAVQKFDGQERLENLSRVIFFDADGNYSPPASKQDAYNRARMAKASQSEAEHLSGHFGSSERTSPEKNHLKTLSLKKAWDQALEKHGEGSPEANMAEWSYDVFQNLSKQTTGQLTPQNIITARKDTFQKLFGKQVQGRWKLPGHASIKVPPTMWYHWINGTAPPPEETKGATWTLGTGKNAGIYTVKAGSKSYQIPTWDAISQSALLKDVKEINQSISIEDGKPEDESILAPQEAIDFLMKNNTFEVQKAFLDKYGYIPDEVEKYEAIKQMLNKSTN